MRACATRRCTASHGGERQWMRVLRQRGLSGRRHTVCNNAPSSSGLPRPADASGLYIDRESGERLDGVAGVAGAFRVVPLCATATGLSI